MFYRLKSDYLLRGWYGMSWVLVQRPSNQVKILAQNMFQILTLCDGETELSDEVLDDTLKDALRQCLADDLVEAGVHAGKLVKEIAAACGGGGGGKADMAQAGAKDSSKISDAFTVAESLLK